MPQSSIVHARLSDTAPRLDPLGNLSISCLQPAPESELSPQTLASFIAPQKNNYRSAASFPFVFRGSIKGRGRARLEFFLAFLTAYIQFCLYTSWSWSFAIELLFDPCSRALHAANSGRLHRVWPVNMLLRLLRCSGFPFTPALKLPPTSSQWVVRALDR
ncbi:hypothetical protein BJY52DRAFT_629687 [Lactarius psammicola]|nr:hypothetical protein BJY52DRAFT_629687 [Lactarius psammicola]